MTPTITVDAGHTVGSVNRLALGHNVEWADFIHPALWDLDAQTWTRQALDDFASAGPTTLRFPGGCYGDHYHWRDGLGPWEGRKTMTNPFTGQPTAAWLATDEFLTLCERTGATPWIQTNPAGESAESMAEWARYCSERGRPVPHWELGNEIYLASPNEPGANNADINLGADEYVKRALAQARAIREVEPDAQIGTIGGWWTYLGPTIAHADWNETVLPALKDDVDFLAVHSCYGPLIVDPAWWARRTEEDLYQAYRLTSAVPQFARENLRLHIERASELTGRSDFGIALTEWLPLFSVMGMEALLCSNSMGAGLYTAGMLNLLVAQRGLVAAHWLTLAKWMMGALLNFDSGETYNLSVNHAIFSLYANHLGDSLVHVDVEGVPTFDAEHVGVIPAQSDVPLIDVLATNTGLFLVNRDLDSSQRVRVVGVSGATHSVSGHWLESNGPVEGPFLRKASSPIRIETGPAFAGDELMLPACSVTVVALPSQS